jgi:hypothetical protein
VGDRRGVRDRRGGGRSRLRAGAPGGGDEEHLEAGEFEDGPGFGRSGTDGEGAFDGAELLVGGEQDAQAGGADVGHGRHVQTDTVLAGTDGGGEGVLHGLAPVGVETTC